MKMVKRGDILVTSMQITNHMAMARLNTKMVPRLMVSGVKAVRFMGRAIEPRVAEAVALIRRKMIGLVGSVKVRGARRW
jgi:hypothetical protein